MSLNRPPVKLCINCRHLVSGACEHKSNMTYSFVDGKFGTANSVEFVRMMEKRPSDGTELCGPTGRFHERAPEPILSLVDRVLMAGM